MEGGGGKEELRNTSFKTAIALAGILNIYIPNTVKY
jgi:hypothetical protein